MAIHLPDIFLGRQPILDRNQHIVAYELLLRESNDSPDVVFAEAQMILGGKKVLFSVNDDWLLSNQLENLPRDQAIINLPAELQLNPFIKHRCQELHAKSFELAICHHQAELYPFATWVKLDLNELSTEQLADQALLLKSIPGKLLAQKVEQLEQAQQCAELGVDWFQGYFFARPALLSCKRADSSKLSLLKLIELILSDADTDELEAVFKREPALSFSLLRMINSAAMGINYRIASIKQAIVTLGQRQLQRWLQLLLFVSEGSDMESPLLELAATRGKLMELLAKQVGSKDRELGDRAFMTGIMSLLDCLLSMPIEEVVSQVNLVEDIEAALLTRQGRLGQLLMLIIHMEQNNQKSIAVLQQELGLNHQDLMRCQLEAMSWAYALKQANN